MSLDGVKVVAAVGKYVGFSSVVGVEEGTAEYTCCDGCSERSLVGVEEGAEESFAGKADGLELLSSRSRVVLRTSLHTPTQLGRIPNEYRAAR